MNRKRILLVLGILIAAIALVSCGTSKNFGQRKAPKDCNCTRWGK